MSGNIREIRPSDLAPLEALYAKAFPNEDLLPLVRELLDEVRAVLSLVFDADGAPIGHAAFTRCSVAGLPETVALLGPIAVLPVSQRGGIGSSLIREGLRQMRNEGVTRVQVLGDPAFYKRFGFEPDTRIATPYPLPDEWRQAWQAVELNEAKPPLEGTLAVPRPWQRPELWGP